MTKREYEVLPNELKKYFSSIEAARRWGGPIRSYLLVPNWKFTTTVKPHYITHRYLLHNEVISEWEYIHKKLWNSDRLAQKYLNYSSGCDCSYCRGDFKKTRLKQIIAKEIEEEIMEL